MNLTNLFNFQFLKQNLKKSKVTLAFVLLILPILNLIIFLMQGANIGINIMNLPEISVLTLIGMYILPIVLSFLLFNFVFKKKSVDFMGSMPIDRKTIFLTNTIGGIGIILLLILVTMALMLGVSIFTPNIYVPYQAFLDYFLLYSTSYIFVFTVSNIAISVAGNALTSLVVVALILFFIPFHHFVLPNVLLDNVNIHNEIMYESNNPILLNHQRDILKVEENNISNEFSLYLNEIPNSTSYTMPFQLISKALISLYDDQSALYKGTIISKTMILSLLYILIGTALFKRKEMEICETSFKKFSTHQLVKSLTLIPIFIIICVGLQYASFIAWLFAICLVLVYNFVYDLITRHNIIKIPQNLCWFIVVFLITSIPTLNMLNSPTSNRTREFTKNDIQKIDINIASFNAFGADKYMTIRDKNWIHEILDGIAIEQYVYNNEEIKNYKPVDAYISISDIKYKVTTSLSSEIYEKLKEEVVKSKVYQSITPKKILETAEIITIGNDLMILDKEGVKLLNAAIDNKPNEDELINIPIHIYTYENHDLKEYAASSSIDKKLQEYVIQANNKKVRELKLNNINSIGIKDLNTFKEYYANTRNAHKILKNAFEQQTIDYDKPVYRIRIYGSNGTYNYYTNIDEKLLSSYTEQVSTYGDVNGN